MASKGRGNRDGATRPRGASAAAVDGEVPTSDMTLLFFPVSADARVAVFARQAIDHFLFFIAGVKTMALVPPVCGKRSPG